MTQDLAAAAAVLLRQAHALGDDIRQLAVRLGDGLAEALDAQDTDRVRAVRVVGCGDSLHAGLAAGMAFGDVPGVDYAAVPAFEYAAYEADPGRAPGPGRELVLAVSASGGTPAALAAVAAASARGAVTVAVVGREGTALGAAADACVVAAVADPEPSPGVRTYSASLLTLVLAARHLAARRRGEDSRSARRHGWAELAAAVDATNVELDERAAAVVERVVDAQALVVLGSGPAYGTARHTAAKLVEGAGVPAFAQDVEEWRHVERFAAPADLPLFVVAPAGRSAERAAQIAGFAAGLGRRVVAVAPVDAAVAARASLLLPVVCPAGAVDEAVSPLVYQVFAPHVAFHWARWLGRAPFRAGESGYRAEG